MITELALSIFDTNDPRFMRIMDISAYNPAIVPDCEILNVTAPGGSYSKQYPIKSGFTELITTVTLYHTAEVGNLPDGIYTIDYSINPNEKMWVEYQHLRTTTILQRYFRAFCALHLDCKMSRLKDERISELREIRGYIDAAKAYVEYCNAPDKGVQIYEFASSSLERLERLLGITKSC